MMPDYKKELQDLIKKQIVILGPDTVGAKVKNVPGLEIDAAGQILKADGDVKALLEKLVEQFVELSSEIVRKTMEALENSEDRGQNTEDGIQKTEYSGASKASVEPVSAEPKIEEIKSDEMSFNPPVNEDLNKIVQEVDKAAKQAEMNLPVTEMPVSSVPPEPSVSPSQSANPISDPSQQPTPVSPVPPFQVPPASFQAEEAKAS